MVVDNYLMALVEKAKSLGFGEVVNNEELPDEEPTEILVLEESDYE